MTLLDWFLLKILTSDAPVARSTRHVQRDTLLSSFRPFQTSAEKASKSLPRATCSGSPVKEGMGSPSEA